MAVNRLGQVSCSLNLGSIYQLDYNYDPNSGTKIRLYFVNKQGIYTLPNLLPPQKSFIRIGEASFTMYAVSAGYTYSQSDRTAWVEFQDEFFKLNNYYIVMPGRGCGNNVFVLGDPVDSRSLAEKRLTALDPIAVQIEELTQFPDYAYSFDSFLGVLRQKFNVQVSTSYDASVKRDTQGSFLEVLQDWCNYYNLSFFFENGVIKIFNPIIIDITKPSLPPAVISYSYEEDITDTYGKTVCNWFQQEGGQYSLSQTSESGDGDSKKDDGGNTSNKGGPLYVRTATLYPMGYEFGLEQPYMDLNQVAAAQYGEAFWFLYNYWQGTTSRNCGWTPISPSASLSIVQTTLNAGGAIASYNPNVYSQKFAAYQEYGISLAGRYYMSNAKTDIAVDQDYTWFEEANGQIFSFNNSAADSRAIIPEYLVSTNSSMSVIKESVINKQFPGFNYFGDRLLYKDDFMVPTGTFFLSEAQVNLVNSSYQALTSFAGNEARDYSELVDVYGGENVYVAYNRAFIVPQDLDELFKQIPQKAEALKPRYSSFPIKGIRRGDYASLKASEKESDNIDVIKPTNSGPGVINNISVIKTEQQGTYTVYYDKYSQCESDSTEDSYYGYRFEPYQVSSDSEVGVTFQKLSNNSYSITRDFSLINKLLRPPGFATAAQARPFPTWRVSYSLNYFDDIPTNFLSAGLVGLNVSIGNNGVTASYSYSNEVLKVPDKLPEIALLQQNIRNSWFRQYAPNRVIT